MNLNSSNPLIAIWGPPRSGTTWLGQIFDSHPEVAYRFQPLFSYRFKAAVSSMSSVDQIYEFMAGLTATDDDFVLQTTKRGNGLVPRFEKTTPTHLVFKEVRYLHLAEHFLATVPNSIAVGIIRHPCATINSWLKTPREFLPEWNWKTEWRYAPSKNRGLVEEYYGFERWQWTARLFLDLEARYPTRFILVRYDDLVATPETVISVLFAQCGLGSSGQTSHFIRLSHSTEVDHPDSVYRKPDVVNRWNKELTTEIRDSILSECRGTTLEQFCR